MPFAGVAPLDDDAAVDGTKLLQGAGRLGGAIIVSAPGLLHLAFDILIDQPGQPVSGNNSRAREWSSKGRLTPHD